MADSNGNGWDEHKRLVEATLEDHGKQLAKIWGTVNGLQVQVGKMEVKLAGILALAMIVSTAVATAVAKWLGP
jgi:hypothetical protein